MRLIITIISFALVVQGCDWMREAGKHPDVSAAKETSLIENFAGEYHGIIQNPGIPGIRTSLILKDDSTYVMNMEFIDHRIKSLSESGKFTLENNIITIKYQNGDSKYYQLDNDKIHILDNRKQRIETLNSAYYTLVKR
jgi:hypothetical protein